MKQEWQISEGTMTIVYRSGAERMWMQRNGLVTVNTSRLASDFAYVEKLPTPDRITNSRGHERRGHECK